MAEIALVDEIRVDNHHFKVETLNGQVILTVYVVDQLLCATALKPAQADELALALIRAGGAR